VRILIDECVDERLRHDFSGHDCQTARYAGFAGLKNGHLLSAAEKAGFEVIVTVDQNIPYQQDLQNRNIAILILRAPTNRLLHLKQVIPAALKALTVIKPREVITVS
jgi:predicted nuclease of predicted toxin-antitoxin system